MARETTITQEQVNATADTIRAEGQRPTARAVRERIGSGSMATVLKFLQAWQSGQVRTVDAPVTLPANLQRALVDCIEQEIAAARANLGDDLAAAQQANADLIAENERQAATIQTQADTIDSERAAIAEQWGRIDELKKALEQSELAEAMQQQAAEHARTELAKAQLRLEALPDLEAQITALRTALEQERAAKTDAEKSAAVALAKLEAAERALKAAEDATEKAEKRAAQAAQEISTARVQVQAQQTALDTAARECDDLRSQAKNARAEAKKAGEVAAELRGKLAATPKPKTTKATA